MDFLEAGVVILMEIQRGVLILFFVCGMRVQVYVIHLQVGLVSKRGQIIILDVGL